MRKLAKAVVLISGGGSNLQAFIDQIDANELSLDIALVISNVPSAYGLKRAQKAGIESSVIDHKEFKDRLSFDNALKAQIDTVNPDVIILAGFMRILTQEFVDSYPLKIVNIHPSLLPKFTGTNTHSRAIEAREEWHGASIHFVIPELDAGPVILQGRLRIHDDDTPESLQQKVHKIEHKLYPTAIGWLADERLSVVNDRVLLDGEISVKQLQTFDL